jgi:hypothetical protein
MSLVDDRTDAARSSRDPRRRDRRAQRSAAQRTSAKDNGTIVNASHSGGEWIYRIASVRPSSREFGCGERRVGE